MSGSETPTGEFHLLGPPGTGKTTALTKRWIPGAVDRFGADAVAVCSLTRAAAVEITGRLGGDLPPERVGTLHSLARRALTDAFGAPGLAQTPEALALWAEAHPDLAFSGAAQRSEDEMWSEGRGGEPKPGTGQQGSPDGALAQMEVLRHRMAPPEEVEAVQPRLYRAWNAWKREQQLLDFTDLIAVALDRGAPLPRLGGSDARCLIVDEAQDLSPLEMALVRMWREDVDMLVLAGDPNQSIYGFRGASPHAFHDPETFPEERTYSLRQSYRVPAPVQECAERFLCRATDRVPVEYAPREAPEASVRRSGFAIQVSPKGVSDDALRLSETGTVMVLATAGYMLRPVIKRLRAAGAYYGNPFRAANGEWNPIRTSRTRVLSLVAPLRPDLRDPDDATAEPRLWTWAELNRWAGLCRATGLLRRGARENTIREMARKRPRAILDRTDLDRIFADHAWIQNELIPLLSDPAREGDALGMYRETMLTSAGARQLGYCLDVCASRGVKVLTQPPPIIVGTCHSVKGGTADHVILAPDVSGKASKGMKWDVEAKNSVIRTMYVGMTRASQTLTLLAPSRRGRLPLPHVAW